MTELLRPRAGMSICDWASCLGGLLLQCIRHVKKHGGDVRQLQLHGQESNVATYNISRINMILHGIPVWEHRQGDSLRDPRHLTVDSRLKQFDRVIMNPPFSLEDWGYDTVVAGDKFGRLSYGMPPASNRDWAWLQQIAKSLKDADPDTGIGGQGMGVMSQGVLFRGQPEQTEEEDGQNRKADAECVIRRERPSDLSGHPLPCGAETSQVSDRWRDAVLVRVAHRRLPKGVVVRAMEKQ